MFGDMKEAPTLRPLFNVGCLFDLLTGNFYPGPKGEYYCSGGLSNVVGLGGRGNSYKSTLAHYLTLSTINRYHDTAQALVYDSEPPALSHQRLLSLSVRFANISENDFIADSPKVFRTDSVEYPGEKFVAEVEKRLLRRELEKAVAKADTLATPFIDSRGSPIKIFKPAIVEIDSLSQMPFSHTEKISQEKEIGDGAANTLEMRMMGAKSALISKMARLPAATGSCWIMTAHMGDGIVIDPHAPSQKKLAFLSSVKFKRVPENYTILTNNLWVATLSSLLVDKDKRPEYPFNKADDQEKSKDLNIVDFIAVRNKTGPSGYTLPMVISQSRGLCVSATEFHFCRKQANYYGIHTTNKQDFTYQLYPTVEFTRRTLQETYNNSYIFQRVSELTSQLLQIKLYPHLNQQWGHLIESPKKIHENLVNRGYNLDVLFGVTRGYWQFTEIDDGLYPLSSLDLLRMNAGEYHPYWYDAYCKKNGIENTVKQ